MDLRFLTRPGRLSQSHLENWAGLLCINPKNMELGGNFQDGFTGGKFAV
jgi:hypothetical protein